MKALILPALTSSTMQGIGLAGVAVGFEIIHHLLPQIPSMDVFVGMLMMHALWLIRCPQKPSDAPPCAVETAPAVPATQEKTP